MTRRPTWQPKDVGVVPAITRRQAIILFCRDIVQNSHVLRHQLRVTIIRSNKRDRTDPDQGYSRLSHSRASVFEGLRDSICRLAGRRVQDILGSHALRKEEECEGAIIVAWSSILWNQLACSSLPVSPNRCQRLRRTSMIAYGRPALVELAGKTVEMTPVGCSCSSRLVF